MPRPPPAGSVRDGGVYACFEGPRFETRAEIRLARLAGADVAGMTGVPEVTLAAEAGLRYAAISLVVNPACGVGDTDEPITMDEIAEVLRATASDVLAVLDELVHTRATFPDTDDRDEPPHEQGPHRERLLRRHRRRRRPDPPRHDRRHRGRRHHRDHGSARRADGGAASPARADRRDRHRRPRQAR